jgi:outer membrane scaffolding protein for murein synthesis (MipA/OmpV family)
MDFYYQVDPAFVTATRPDYDAGAGYLGSKFTAALTRQVNDRTSIGMSASFYLYRGAENRTSPLFRRNTGFSIQAVWLKTLAESDKRVMPRARR